MKKNAQGNIIYPEDFIIAALYWSGISLVTDSRESWHTGWHAVVQQWPEAHEAFNDWRDNGEYLYCHTLDHSIVTLRDKILIATSHRHPYIILRNIDLYYAAVAEEVRETPYKQAYIVANIVQERLWAPLNRWM